MKLVCFDLGRVLLRTCDNLGHACRVAGIEVGDVAELTDAQIAQLEHLASLLDTDQIDLQTWADAVAPIRGLTAAQVIGAHNAFLQGVYPGAVELVDEIAAAGVQTACLSNTNPEHWKMICDPSLPAHFPVDRFTYRFASHLIRLRKPDAAIYQHVEETARAKPAQIVFFDDLAENIAAAKSRGWWAHLIDPTKRQVTQMRTELRRHGVLR